MENEQNKKRGDKIPWLYYKVMIMTSALLAFLTGLMIASFAIMFDQLDTALAKRSNQFKLLVLTLTIMNVVLTAPWFYFGGAYVLFLDLDLDSLL